MVIEMKRSIYKDLLRWKRNKLRKPLIIDGARQVGKTWVIKEFGKNEYKNDAQIGLQRYLVRNKFRDLICS